MFDSSVVFKQKTAYEMRISDWSSDVCSSDLHDGEALRAYLRDHLVQLVPVIDHEVAHAIDAVGGLDDRARLHRMPEVGVGLVEGIRHLRDLSHRGGIEMADAALVERAKPQRMRIALHRIDHSAGKLPVESPASARENVGDRKRTRLNSSNYFSPKPPRYRSHTAASQCGGRRA